MNGLICLFAKTPRYAGVKTRLEPVLGAEKCLRLHKWLVEDRLEMLADFPPEQIALYVTEDVNDDYWLNLLPDSTTGSAFSRHVQKGKTLGERMQNAVEKSLASRDWVILIGADCPDLDSSYIQSAVSALESGQEAVIGPAKDGGYVLLGLRVAVADVFQGIDWGTEFVFAQTIDAIEKKQLNYSSLSALRDLDIEEDLFFYSEKIEAISNLFK